MPFIVSIIKNYYLNHWLIFSLLLGYITVLLVNSAGGSLPQPSCIVTHFTGHACFGCGLNRAAIALLQLEFSKAYQINALIYVYTILIGTWVSFDFYKFYRQSIYLKQP